jgi:soluble lytic murein transglycosylase
VGTPVPKPAPPSQEEAEHAQRLDKAIAALTSHEISADDASRIRDAFRAIDGNEAPKAIELKKAVRDEAGRKLIAWYLLRSGYGTAAELAAFLDANPAWPDRKRLAERLEEALFVQGGRAADIRAHFKDRAPVSGSGFAALASAHLAEGNEAEAKKLAQQAWRGYDLPAALEPAFLSRFGKYLGAGDHKWRLDRLLIDTLRWSGEKNARAALVRRVIARLPAPEQKKAQARLAVFLGAKGAKKLVDALPAEREPDWGLVFHRIQSLRRTGKVEEAAKLLLGAPTEEAKIVVPDQWWAERRANAYETLKAGKPKLAYELVREAGPLSVNPLKEQTFMAGWLALRYLKDPALAEPHFLAMRKAADGPLSRAKASYWLGRTAEARGDMSAAQEHYRAALRDPDTFHAFLARQKLEPGRQPILTEPPAEPTREEIERFTNLDAAQAAVIAKKAGLDPFIMRLFIAQLRVTVTREAEAAMVAHLALAMGDTQSAVRAGKAAIARGHNLVYYAYPVHPFPAYSALRPPPEPAFLLGVARQETEFNTLTVSGAGAKGLLQVMTVTARHICRDYKIKCDFKRLLSDPSYNAMLASAYIADRMEEFSGSYVLTLAGYNAGPGRAREWIREFGDPRDPKVDPIDWIERIPIQETREYVAKVLSNIQMYRARLGEEQAALRLEEDLNRARRVAGRGAPATGATDTANSDG